MILVSIMYEMFLYCFKTLNTSKKGVYFSLKNHFSLKKWHTLTEKGQGLGTDMSIHPNILIRNLNLK